MRPVEPFSPAAQTAWTLQTIQAHLDEGVRGGSVQPASSTDT